MRDVAHGNTIDRRAVSSIDTLTPRQGAGRRNLTRNELTHRSL